MTVDKKESPKPDVTPELAFENGHWIFLNFHYPNTGSPNNENLLALLQQLKKERKKQGETSGWGQPVGEGATFPSPRQLLRTSIPHPGDAVSLPSVSSC